jgi:hypothetical protein
MEIEIVIRLLNGVDLKHKRELISSCPFCNKEKHFYLNKKTFVYNCKKCDASGNIKTLLKFLDKEYLLDDEGKTVNLQLRKVGESIIEDVEDLEPKKILLPVGFRRIYQNDYLEKKRGLTEIEFMKYKIGSTRLISKLKDYALFVVEEKGKVVGWLGRYCGNKKDAIRYINATGVKFDRLLFGFNEITPNTKKIILVEGIFDKIKIDRVFELDNDEEIKCLCTFGKKFSETQIKKLRVFPNINSVTICYDYDAMKEMKKLGFELKKFWDTTITYTKKKDVDECTDYEVLEIFNNLQTPQEFFLKNLIKL